MLRKYIITKITNIAKELGWDTHVGFLQTVDLNKSESKMLVVEPPILTKIHGLNEQKFTYKITLFIISKSKFKAGWEQENVWTIMELDAVEIYRQLINDQKVWAINSFTSTPQIQNISMNQDNAMKVDLELQLLLFNDQNNN